MQRGITRQTQINSSWTDITTGLVPGPQSMKTGNDGMECVENQCAHSIPPSHALCWFASTPPVREPNGSDVQRPSSSDFAYSVGADNVSAAQKTSDAAEHTKHICSWPRPKLSKRFRRPVVGPLGSCLNKQADLCLQQRELDRDFASGLVLFFAS